MRRKVLALSLGIPAAVIVAPTLATVLPLIANPRLSGRALRRAFDNQAERVALRMDAVQSPATLSYLQIAYRRGDPDALLDIHRPSSPQKDLPVVMWLHGGGWLSGSKETITPYLRILADRGIAAAGVEYSIAPGRRYPWQLHQIADALAHLVDHGSEFGLDPRRIVLAGDSAGAHLAAQLAIALRNPDYADLVGLHEATRLSPSLVGMVLACGPYDVGDLWRRSPALRGMLRIVGIAYAGSGDFRRDPRVMELSLPPYLPDDFPPTFLTAGNADVLAPESYRFAAALRAHGVPVTTRFFAPDHRPRLGHEYQFHLDLPDARETLDAVEDFVRSVTGLPPAFRGDSAPEVRPAAS